MSSNVSSSTLLTLQSLEISEANLYPASVLSILMYLLIMVCNSAVLTAIIVSKTLHKPMFILLFNLPLSDMIGATAFFPHLVSNLLSRSRDISFPGCVTQAFFLHFYGTANLLTLCCMAYDRYVAICSPLHYYDIMTPQTLIRMILFVWLFDFSSLLILFTMMAWKVRCRTHVVDLICNNPSLLKLVCEDIRANNYYGLVTLCMVQGGTLVTMVYTYTQILRTCFSSNQSEARRRAIQTCSSHLVVFLFFQLNSVTSLLSHRFEKASPVARRILGVSIMIFPPFLDPVIYGLKITELKESIKRIFKRSAGSIQG